MSKEECGFERCKYDCDSTYLKDADVNECGFYDVDAVKELEWGCEHNQFCADVGPRSDDLDLDERWA